MRAYEGDEREENGSLNSYTVVRSELMVDKPERTVAAERLESGAALMKELLRRRAKMLETSILKVYVLSKSCGILYLVVEFDLNSSVVSCKLWGRSTSDLYIRGWKVQDYNA